MRALIFGFLIFGIWATFGRYYYVCKIKGHCGDKKEEVITDVREKTLSLKLGDKNILEGYDQFSFPAGEFKPTLNDNNDLFLDTLATLLSENQDKKLKIKGHFLASEKDIKAGRFDNIGLARADAVREALREIGGEVEGRVSLDYEEVPGTVLTNPVSFELLESDNNELDDVAFTFTNMTFTESNFATNEDIFTPQESFLTYADSMNIYFELNPDKTLTITGHADVTGTARHNKSLGQRRAESAKQFLIEQGIGVKIIATSMGEKQPMDTNKTKEGRAKNRRVNFKIE